MEVWAPEAGAPGAWVMEVLAPAAGAAKAVQVMRAGAAWAGAAGAGGVMAVAGLAAVVVMAAPGLVAGDGVVGMALGALGAKRREHMYRTQCRSARRCGSL